MPFPGREGKGGLRAALAQEDLALAIGALEDQDAGAPSRAQEGQKIGDLEAIASPRPRRNQRLPLLPGQPEVVAGRLRLVAAPPQVQEPLVIDLSPVIA